jgi:hypothetical protein
MLVEEEEKQHSALAGVGGRWRGGSRCWELSAPVLVMREEEEDEDEGRENILTCPRAPGEASRLLPSKSGEVMVLCRVGRHGDGNEMD